MPKIRDIKKAQERIISIAPILEFSKNGLTVTSFAIAADA